MFISSMEWLKKEEDILYNSQFFLDDTGVLLGTYRKVHLFDSEKNYFTEIHQIQTLFDFIFFRYCDSTTMGMNSFPCQASFSLIHITTVSRRKKDPCEFAHAW